MKHLLFLFTLIIYYPVYAFGFLCGLVLMPLLKGGIRGYAIVSVLLFEEYQQQLSAQLYQQNQKGQPNEKEILRDELEDEDGDIGE